MLHKILSIRILVLSFLTLVSVAYGAGRPINAWDLWSFKRLSDPSLSPDGKYALVSVQAWSVEKNKSTANLWLIEVKSGDTRRLTFSEASDTSPVFSPEGRRIAFVSKRGEDKAASLYVLSLDGGEAEKLVEMPFGLSTPKWLPDGSGLVFGTRVIPELAGRLGEADLAAMRKELALRKDSKMTARVTEDRIFKYWDQWLTEAQASRLVRLDLKTRTLTDLTPQSTRLFTISGDIHFDLSPKGDLAALVIDSAVPPQNQSPNHDIYLVPLDGSGTLRNLTVDNPHSDADPLFSRDGEFLFFGRQVLKNSAGENRKLFSHTLSTGKNRDLTGHLDYSFGAWATSSKPGQLWVLAEEKGLVPLFALDLGAPASLAKRNAQGTVSGLASAADAVVALADSASMPAELYSFDTQTGERRQLTRFNELLLSELELGRQESLDCEGADGARLQLWLTYPPSYDEKQSYPLLQLLHGGPNTMCRDSWSYRWNSQVFAALGYLVVWVNRHGSTGFGEAFARSINGEWGQKPFIDIQKSTDFLLAKFPKTDPKKVAVAGASYGGYLATWIAGHTDRYATIVNHAGVSDFGAQSGCDVVFWFEAAVDGTICERPENWERNNPIQYAQQMVTPMLILHGELDYRVPYGQALTLYSALKTKGVPSRLVVFPNENHWILTPQNAIHWNYEVQTWLARYLGGKSMEKPVFAASKTQTP